jgi:hypothetical protein
MKVKYCGNSVVISGYTGIATRPHQTLAPQDISPPAWQLAQLPALSKQQELHFTRIIVGLFSHGEGFPLFLFCIAFCSHPGDSSS